MKQRIGIIGGGLSGLSTAAHLLLGAEEDFAIDVFEAAPFFGGQCASWLDAKGRPTEAGIHLDFPWYHNKDALFVAIGRPLPLRETDGNHYVCNGATGKIDALLAGKSVFKTRWGPVTFPGLTHARNRATPGNVGRGGDRVGAGLPGESGAGFEHAGNVQAAAAQRRGCTGMRMSISLLSSPSPKRAS